MSNIFLYGLKNRLIDYNFPPEGRRQKAEGKWINDINTKKFIKRSHNDDFNYFLGASE